MKEGQRENIITIPFPTNSSPYSYITGILGAEYCRVNRVSLT